MSCYIGNILVQETWQGKGGNVDDIFDATLMQSASVEVLRGAKPLDASRDKQEEYIKMLEDKLELGTKQLIDAGTRLLQMQAELEEALVEAKQQCPMPSEDSIMNGLSTTVGNAADSETYSQLMEQIHKLESSLKKIEKENVSLCKESKQLREKLNLVLEKLALSKEELEAHDKDRREYAVKLDVERNHHKEEVAALQGQIEKFSYKKQYHELQSKSMEEALMELKEETQTLREEVEQLELALQNYKEDYEALQDEMEDLRTALDESPIKNALRLKTRIRCRRNF
jgi:chromosome segregation ATPase